MTTDQRPRPPAPDHEMVLATLVDAVLVLTAAGQVCYANPAAEVLLQRSRATLEGLPVSSLFASTPWLGELLRRLHETPETTLRGEGKLQESDASEIVAVATVLHDRNGRANGSVLGLHDTRSSRWLQRDEVARERLAELDRLVSSVGHELNNPLSGIRGAAQILSKKLDDDPDLADYGAMIVRQVDRMAAMISKLMTLETPSPPMESVNIHRILDEVTMLERSDAERRGIAIETGFDPSLPPVLGNADQLEQLFLNLLKNAVAACPQERGRIRIATRMEHSFYIDTKSGRLRYLAVEVSDNGPGLDEETLRNMFSPFYSRTAGGHGIGLAIARNIVAAHKGQLRAERCRDGGARLCVTLPVAEERHQEEP